MGSDLDTPATSFTLRLPNRSPPLQVLTCMSVRAGRLVDVGRGAKNQVLVVKWGFPTKPQ